MAEQKNNLILNDYINIVFNSAPIAANLWSAEHELLLCNQEALRLFCVPDMEQYFKRFNDLSPEYQPCGKLSEELRFELHNKALVSGYERFDWVNQTLDGVQIPCEVTLIRIEHQGKHSVAAYKRDLREHIEKAEATRANKAKSALLATVSHEIRTPMNAILGMAEIQLLNNTTSKEAKEAFGLIYDSGNLLVNIINDILDFSKMEAGKLKLNIDKYELPSVIYDATQLICHRYESVPIEFALKIDPNTPFTLLGDQLRIKQILNNLLSNAFKYTEEGFVKFSVSAESASNDVATLVLRVSDSGKGMSEDQLEQLFDEYTRFNTETNRYSDGTGLGMSITKRLVDLMDGEITVKSQPGKGTTFTVRLPQKRLNDSVCGEKVEKNLQEPLSQRTAKTSRMQFTREYMPYGRVLIVDDVETNLYVAEGMLVPYGLRVESVLSAKSAIHKIRDGGVYDIIFMDHMMPGMNGVEAVKILRDMGYDRTIIALTANAVAGQSEMFMANGFDGFISKPVDARELNALLKTFIRDKHPAEVIKAARLEKHKETQKEKKEEMKENPKSNAIPERIKKAFLSDAKRIIASLDELFPRLSLENEEDIQSYIVSVHGIKNALVIVNEKLISALAYKLEHEGRNRNIKVMMNETPLLLSELRELVARLESDNSDGDIAVLRSKMLLVMTACSANDKKIAETTLDELKQKNWSEKIKENLDAISMHLRNGEFNKASEVASGFIGE